MLKEYGILGYKDLFFLRKFSKWKLKTDILDDNYDLYNSTVYYLATKINPNSSDKKLQEFNRISDILIKLNIVQRDSFAPYEIENSFDIMFAMIFSRTSFIPFELEPEPDLYQKYKDLSDGLEFEHFIANLLEKNGYSNVEVTQGSGDQGIDVLASLNDITYAIQCKLYTGNVGNEAVQQVSAGKQHYKTDVGVVITNSNFTKSAIELAESNNIKLWDGSIVESLIEKVK